MNRHTQKVLRRQAFAELAAVGAANGIGNRARSIPSKRDKARDAKRQRRAWRNQYDG